MKGTHCRALQVTGVGPVAVVGGLDSLGTGSRLHIYHGVPDLAYR